MKKILPFIIGVLVGVTITTAGFLIYNKIVKKDFNPEMIQRDGKGPMEMPFDGNMIEFPEDINKINPMDSNNTNILTD